MRLFNFIILSVLSSCIAINAYASSSATYQVGFAEQDITPNKTLTMGGFGTFVLWMKTRKSSLGVHDPIKTNSICISADNGDPIAIASADVIGLTSNSIDRVNGLIQKQLGTVHTIIAATHNHHSPDTYGIWGQLPDTGRDKDYMNFLEKTIAQTIIKSCESRQQARLKVITQNLNNVRRNKTVYDDQVVTLYAEAADGRVFGTLTQWSSSPSTLSKHNNTISADFVGAYRHYLSQKQSGTHVYVNGALGKVHGRPEPVVTSDPFQLGEQDPDIKERYIKSANIGYVLAELVNQGLVNSKAIPSNAMAVKTQAFSIPMKSKVLYYLGSLDIIDKQFQKETIQTRLTWFQIGPLQIVSVPGEMFPQGTAELREDLIKLGNAKQTMVIGLAQDWLGYFLSREQYDNPDYWYYRLLSPHRDAAHIMREQLSLLLDLEDS